MIIDDGKVALIKETVSIRFRLVDHVPNVEEGRGGAVEVIGHALNQDEIVLSGVQGGRCSPAHLRMICKTLINDAFRFAYAQWVDGKTAPFATAVKGGKLDGWEKIDLIAWRFGQRYTKQEKMLT